MEMQSLYQYVIIQLLYNLSIIINEETSYINEYVCCRSRSRSRRF